MQPLCAISASTPSGSVTIFSARARIRRQRSSRSASSVYGRAAAPSTTAEGIISEYVSIASFKVGGRKVNANSAKFENGVAADLADGRRVEVEGTLSGDVLMASRVEFKAGDVSPWIVDIKGAISAYVSKASFKVAGQAVDATGATFDGGTAADLADGRVVEVVGTIVNGSLIATQGLD